MKTVGIVGFGIVGKATEISLRSLYNATVPITVYDTAIKDSKIDDVAKCDFIFICVPTPSNEDGSCNISIVENVVKNLAILDTKGIIIIRSTVIPGTTSYLRDKYKLRINFMPEFLTEATYEDDAQHPDILVFGGPEFKEIESLFFQYKENKIFSTCSSKNAEMLKYGLNTFFTTKVIFANELYDICEEEHCNYEFVKNVMYHHKWVGNNHLDVMYGGFRGAGGKCLNKDTKAIVAKYKTKLLTVVNEINSNLLSESKK